MRRLEQIGLIANQDKPHWRENLLQAAERIRGAGRRAVAPQVGIGTEDTVPWEQKDTSAIVRRIDSSDLVMVIGGDGTMLHAAREIRGETTPVIGINTGNLGFLTAAPMAQLPMVLDHLWQGDFKVATRPFLEAEVAGMDQRADPLTALNDFVVHRRELSRMVKLKTSVDGRHLTDYQCDGLIVCTPTGSTAYSLSAGGPIISPKAGVMAITPICPHALSNRSVIVPLDSSVEVRIGEGHPETVLSGDGQNPQLLPPGATIRIGRSRRELNYLQVGGAGFFQTLREKMKWSGTSF